jgi:hypothetical protein
MATEQLITIQQFCTYYDVEVSFIDALNEHGLIEIISTEEARYIDQEKIRMLEKMINLHYDLDINIEGIDAISHLLDRVSQLQRELNALKNRLMIYEGR